MIIWGIRKYSIYTDIDHGIQCPHCSDKEEGVELEVSRKHLRIFWIPTLAFRKKLSLRCLNCGSKIKLKSLRDSEQVRLMNLKGKHRAPLWQFSGLFVLAIFIAIMIPVIQNSNAADLEKIKNPEMGYYLRYRVPGGGYSSYYIESVSKDTVLLRPLELSSRKMTRLYQIEKLENHSDSLIYWSKSDLLQEYTDGSIYGIRVD